MAIDLIEIFKFKTISSMNDDELRDVFTKVEEFRKEKFKKAKKLSTLDKILKILTVEKSHIIVQKMQEQEQEKEKEKKEEKEIKKKEDEKSSKSKPESKSKQKPERIN